MRRKLATTLLAASAVVALAGPASAAPPTAQHQSRVEGTSGSFQLGDELQALSTARHRYLHLTATEDSTGDVTYYYYGTRHSTFFLNVGCDADGRTVFDDVSRHQFFQRIRSSGVKEFTAVYDQATDSGTFTANTFSNQGGDPDTCNP